MTQHHNELFQEPAKERRIGLISRTSSASPVKPPGRPSASSRCGSPRAIPAPQHVHHNEHETFYTVEGELEYTIGNDTINGEAGTIVPGPKGIPHSFSNESDTEAIAHTWVHPAGFGEFMARAAPLLTDPSDPPDLDMERVLELAPEDGVEFLVNDGDGPVGGDYRRGELELDDGPDTAGRICRLHLELIAEITAWPKLKAILTPVPYFEDDPSITAQYSWCGALKLDPSS